MRHARKAAAQVTMTMLLSATICASPVAVAQAIDFNGGTSASTSEGAPAGSAAPSSGAGASSAAPDTAGAGGAVAPSIQGTGGSQYGVVAHKPAVPKRAPRKISHTSRRTHAAPKPKAPPVKPAKPAPTKSTPGVPSPTQTTDEGALFPVIGTHNFGDAANRFGASRVGHVHEGQDVLASEGQEVIAPLAGTIITTAYQAGGAGWYAAEHTVDGLDFFFAHCEAGSLGVSTGEAVHAGQIVCKVGQTGDAVGAHLHFEVWVGGWQAAAGHPIDPLPYLEAWDHPVGG